MSIEQDLDNISNAILDLLQLVTYEAVRAHTFREAIYAVMKKESGGHEESKKFWLGMIEKEKEYATILEYMSRAFREMRESETNND